MRDRRLRATSRPVMSLVVALAGLVGLLVSGAVPRAAAPDAALAGAPPAPVVPVASHAPMPEGCASSPGCSEVLPAPAGWKLRVFDNFPMTGSNQVTQAVIVVHGTGRNAAGYFASMMAAATQAGAADTTMVIAPWFKTSADDPGAGEATWTNDAWKIGGAAQTPKGLSSFLVMDQLITTLALKQRFPTLRHITVAGHSAGGQFTQRYAAFGLAPNALPGVSVSYIAANPSSFVYFTPDRPTNSDSGDGFGRPAGSCEGYDDYKYGLQGRTGYTAQLTPAQALANYASRQVTIVNGAADTTQNGDMDTDCGAMLQGPNRAARGANYLRYLHSIAPTTATRHSRIVVPGVDHDGEAIFTAPSVRARLFTAAGAAVSGLGERLNGTPSNAITRPAALGAGDAGRSRLAGISAPATSDCSVAGVLDLRRWKLTLPAGDSESPTEILPAALGRVSSAFFRPTARCDGVAFRAPVTGATTKGSAYPRSELRELNPDGSPAAWSSSSGTHSIAVREAFTGLPQGKPQLVGLQIHDTTDDVSVFRLEGSKLYVTNGNDPHYRLVAPNYQVGAVFTAAYLVRDGAIWAYYNGRPVARLSKRFDGAYFKAGAYTQANCSNSAPCADGNYGETVIYALRVEHG